MSAATLDPTPQIALKWRDLAIALAGPAAVGACIGWSAGAAALLQMSIMLPLSFVGVTLATLPALYVGVALAGQAPNVQTMLKIASAAQRDLGLILLGLAPALLFMCATATDVHEALVFGTLGVVLGSMVGARAFYTRFRQTIPQWQALGIFALWALLTGGLGWEIYLNILRTGGQLL